MSLVTTLESLREQLEWVEKRLKNHEDRESQDYYDLTKYHDQTKDSIQSIEKIIEYVNL